MRVLIGIDPHLRPPTPSRPSTRTWRAARVRRFLHQQGRSALACAMGQTFPGAPLAGRWKVPEGWDAPSPSLRLVAAGEMVIDVVPAKLSSRARLLLATGNARKNDRVDAFHVALAALGGERLAEVDEEEQAEVLRMLSERREDLTSRSAPAPSSACTGCSQTSWRVQLRRTSRPRRPLACCAACGSAALPHVLGEDWPQTFSEMSGALTGSSVNSSGASGRSSQRGLHGLDPYVWGRTPILAAKKIIGRVGNVARFPTKAHYFASYTGTEHPSRPQAGRWFVTGSRGPATESSTTCCI